MSSNQSEAWNAFEKSAKAKGTKPLLLCLMYLYAKFGNSFCRILWRERDGTNRDRQIYRERLIWEEKSWAIMV